MKSHHKKRITFFKELCCCAAHALNISEGEFWVWYGNPLFCLNDDLYRRSMFNE